MFWPQSAVPVADRYPVSTTRCFSSRVPLVRLRERHFWLARNAGCGDGDRRTHRSEPAVGLGSVGAPPSQPVTPVGPVEQFAVTPPVGIRRYRSSSLRATQIVRTTWRSERESDWYTQNNWWWRAEPEYRLKRYEASVNRCRVLERLRRSR